MSNVDQYLEIVKETHPDVLFGISKLDHSGYQADYKCALLVVVPHSRRMSIAEYKEEEFEALIHEARERSIKVISEVAGILKKNGIHFYIPAPAQTSEEELAAPISYKYTAVKAGLGWIGKNDVLITEKYGPEVSLNAILIDEEIKAGEPIVRSKCPLGCDLCIRACPYDVFSGNLWNIDSKRHELIHYHLCNQKRSLYKKTHNRKHACGFCMAACPVGREENVR